MNSSLKKLDLDSIFSVIEMIENTNPITIEKVGPISKILINQDVLDENKKNDERTEYFNKIIRYMDLETILFDYLKEKDEKIKTFIEHYTNLYSMSISQNKIDEYTSKLLGNDYKKTIINVAISNGNTYRPVNFFISYRSDYDINTNRMYSDDEVLRLIELKEIIVRSNPLYNDYEKDEKCFICGLEDSTDLENENVVNFTLKYYPFIYEDLRDAIDDSKIDEDKHTYREDRKNGLREIVKYYNEIRLEHIKKANNIETIEAMCIKKIRGLNSKKSK